MNRDSTSPCPPIVAGALSLLLPGLGQLACGDRPKGLALACMSVGLLGGIGLAAAGPAGVRSPVGLIMLAAVTPLVWVPAAVDAYQHAAGSAAPMLTNARTGYLILMLLTIGPMALPMLWQSARLSRRAKIGWTAAVILIALLAVLAALVIGPALERALDAAGWRR